MKIEITGEAKEIAALVLAVQERQKNCGNAGLTMPYNADLLVSQGLQNGFKGEKFVRFQNNTKVNE